MAAIISPILIFALLCITSSRINRKGVTPTLYEIQDELEFEEVEGPYKYIFLRLYDAEYASSLNPTNILKFGITATEVSDMRVSHASINFDLNDEFYALSFGGKYQVGKESCMDVNSNKFMKKCNPETSNQITFAIRVTEEEYNKTKQFVEEYAASPEVKYDMIQNLKIARFATKRKFFTEKEEQSFGNVYYPDFDELAEDYEDKDEDFRETHFVCSTFVAYALMHNIPRIGEWFKDKKIDFRYVGVSDLGSLPGVVQLFSSKFYEYDTAAKLFVEKHPEFAPYFTIKEENK